MAFWRINSSWLQYASSRNVSWWISPTPRIWNATWWCPSSRLSSARISITTSGISLVISWSHASTNAWSHASSYARVYASSADSRLHATTYARNGSWLCSTCYDGSALTDGGTRILPLASTPYGYFISRCPWKTNATQNN